MLKRYCDICRKEIEAKCLDTNTAEVYSASKNNRTNYDLCDNCLENVINYINSLKQGKPLIVALANN